MKCWARTGRRINEGGRWGPYRQASPPPARHGPGARSARRPRCLFSLSQTEGDFTMGLRKRSVLRLEPLEDRCLPSADVVLQWNQVLLDTFKADRSSAVFFGRDAAIVHTAIYDAVNDIDRSHTPLFADVKAPRGASLEAAAAQAAHDTLAALFPAQQATFDATLAADLAGIPPGRARLGVAVGQEVARQILAWRSTDGSTATVTYVPGSGPGVWQPTPRPNPNPPPAELPGLPAVAPQWGHVTPFCIPG